MTRDEFILHLKDSSLAALKFAESFVKDKLTTDFKYNVVLNASYDDINNNQFDHYPEDDGVIKLDLTENEVIELLHRKNKVPVWININVSKSNKNKTTLHLYCAGRYTDNKNELYYKNKIGSSPFGIKSPRLPNDFFDGKKFNLEE